MSLYFLNRRNKRSYNELTYLPSSIVHRPPSIVHRPMSGIVGLVHLDDSPIDPALLHKLTMSMSQRGPDAQNTWQHNQVGLGHTLLITTDEARYEQQPMSYDNRLWITADARIDGRKELLRQLALKKQSKTILTDPELILLAYDKWGTACVQYLIGDFAFAIWDEPRQTLFSARDHFGIKPFYYAVLPNGFLFSNALNCVRQHPAISNSLNDAAIGDFLLFRFNQDLSTTTFQDISSLPPAHTLTFSAGRVTIDCYWSLPTNNHIQYRDPQEYIDQFRKILWEAVGDRLRISRIAVSMSGGLDSTAIAATTKARLQQNNEEFHLSAHTLVSNFTDDEEYYFSKVAAQFIGIPVQYTCVSDYTFFQTRYPLPEPANNPLVDLTLDYFKTILPHSRVILSGIGGDPALYPEPAFLLDLLIRFRIKDFLATMHQFLQIQRRLPPIYLRTNLRTVFAKGKSDATRPSGLTWLNPCFAKRIQIQRVEPITPHGVHKAKYKAFCAQFWTRLFEHQNPGIYAVPLEIRYPFFDLRLLNYLFTIPPVPWCENKLLLRLATRTLLPDQIRFRPKTPLPSRQTTVRHDQLARIDYGKLANVPGLARFINIEQFLAASESIVDLPTDTFRYFVATVSLAFWLQQFDIENIMPV